MRNTIATRIFFEGKYFCNWVELDNLPKVGEIFTFSSILELKVIKFIKKPFGQARFSEEIFDVEVTNLDLTQDILDKNRFMEIDFPSHY